MTTTPRWWQRITERRHDLRVKRVTASRALYQGPDASTIELRFELDDGLGELTLTLTPRQGHTLIQQTTAAYLAINPPLRSGQNFGMMGGL
jgi:hypothetical protein